MNLILQSVHSRFGFPDQASIYRSKARKGMRQTCIFGFLSQFPKNSKSREYNFFYFEVLLVALKRGEKWETNSYPFNLIYSFSPTYISAPSETVLVWKLAHGPSVMDGKVFILSLSPKSVFKQSLNHGMTKIEGFILKIMPSPKCGWNSTDMEVIVLKDVTFICAKLSTIDCAQKILYKI